MGNNLYLVKMLFDTYGDLGYGFGNNSLLYPMTTENINGFLSKYDLKNKKVLTVAGSGDQRLNAYLMGADDVTCFDINELCKYHLDLKDKAIINLSYEEFLKFFGFLSKDSVFQTDLFMKIQDRLDPDTFDLFYYLLFEKEGFHPNDLYRPFHSSLESQKVFNAYLTEENYKTLQDVLSSKELKFIPTSIINLPNEIEGEKYDVIYLSNISDYIHTFYSKDALHEYRLLIDRLIDHLSDDGMIQVGYIYSRYPLGSYVSDFSKGFRRCLYFPIPEFETVFFDSYYDDSTYDKAVVYQKKKKDVDK